METRKKRRRRKERRNGRWGEVGEGERPIGRKEGASEMKGRMRMRRRKEKKGREDRLEWMEWMDGGGTRNGVRR